MKKQLILISYLLFNLTSFPVIATAFDDEDDVIPRNVQVNMLLQKNNCLACHEDLKTKIGPKYADVAKKYKGNANAVGLLVLKIKEGGVGVWGSVPMPAFKFQISDNEIKEIVNQILAM